MSVCVSTRKQPLGVVMSTCLARVCRGAFLAARRIHRYFWHWQGMVWRARLGSGEG
jgi:hypothetical protein